MPEKLVGGQEDCMLVGALVNTESVEVGDLEGRPWEA